MTYLEEHWGAFYLVTEWIIRLTMVVLVPLRRSPEAARSWLLLLFFLPIPGLILYLAIGRPRFPKWRRQRFAGNPRSGQTDAALTAAGADFPADIEMARQPVARLVANLGGMTAVGGNDLRLLYEYDDTVESLCSDIDGARDHVHLLVYIFADDDVGMQVVEALGRAARRGVSCRVMIDALGSRPWRSRVIAAMQARGVDAREVLPVRPLRWRPARADLRNHRKLTIIDGEIGYIGSQNIVAADFRPGIRNQELVARTTGPIVAQLQSVFLSDWYLETEQQVTADALFPATEPRGSVSLQLLPSGPDYPVSGSERLTVELIYAARERVVITTPYFIPDEGLIEAIQSAVLRGVDVRLVVSLVQDQLLVGLAQRSFYAEMLRAGVRLFLYEDRLLHAKHITVDDDLATIGSSNVDIRSFTLNAEANLVIYTPGEVRRVRAVEERYFEGSRELTYQDWARRPFMRKIAENLARLISPLL
ncbi:MULTISPECIES: cardiolipin synthase [Sphingobium]|uniref:Cardiolipin synthase n=1 Tax=Sphingobium lactosutens DS20 TaxID=1331060 RepID=T0IMF7_9SPHN|nr:cardiolipin synthase [Sphingobium lactosutens]EQB10799.1 phospholipase [Sphingobium lactosutens DS20]